MTNVIAFKAPSTRGAPRPKVDGTAEILFFMGVRYVRDEPPPATPDPLLPAGAIHAPAAVEERLHA